MKNIVFLAQHLGWASVLLRHLFAAADFVISIDLLEWNVPCLSDTLSFVFGVKRHFWILLEDHFSPWLSFSYPASSRFEFSSRRKNLPFLVASKSLLSRDALLYALLFSHFSNWCLCLERASHATKKERQEVIRREKFLRVFWPIYHEIEFVSILGLAEWHVRCRCHVIYLSFFAARRV